MSATLNASLPERRTWPYAVGCQMPGEAAPTYVHFANKDSADFYAMLLDTESNHVTRWVAVLDEAVLHSVELGWRQVTYFLLAGRDADRMCPACGCNVDHDHVADGQVCAMLKIEREHKHWVGTE